MPGKLLHRFTDRRDKPAYLYTMILNLTHQAQLSSSLMRTLSDVNTDVERFRFLFFHLDKILENVFK